MSIPVLNLPLLLNPKRPKPYIKPKHLKSWINTLPTANTLKSTRLVIEKLKTLNESKYPYSERVQLLDILRPTIRQLLVTLKQSLHRAEFPLSENNIETYQLIQKLLFKIALAYKLVSHTLMNKTSLKENDKLILRESIYLSIQYLARSVVESYLIYRSPQYDIWRELHQLYLYAENNDIQHEAIDDPFPDFALPLHYTIDLVYKRIVLLSLSSPFHLMQNEADDIYFLVSAWTSVCKISELNKNFITDQYAVDFATDMSPRYIPDSLEWQPVDGRIIDISEVKLRLQSHTKKILQQNSEFDEFIDEETPRSLKERKQRDMLLRLTDNWYRKPVRRTNREDRGAKLRIALGLNACHFYSSNKIPFTPEMDELKLHSSDENKQSTVFANIYRDALQKDRIHEKSDYVIDPWHQNNISHTGISTTCGNACVDMKVKVGEIVSYLFDSKNGRRWKIGVIRWIKMDDNNQVDMGIMNLSLSAVPVAVKALEGIGKGTDYFRSLLIPKYVSIQQQRSIIVPSMLYDIGTVLSVNMKTKLFYIKLKSRLLSSCSISVYEFDILENAPIDLSQKI
ncbi:MAG: hypothetical protein QM484_08025 [Woeseiaceae bacterium]